MLLIIRVQRIDSTWWHTQYSCIFKTCANSIGFEEYLTKTEDSYNEALILYKFLVAKLNNNSAKFSQFTPADP